MYTPAMMHSRNNNRNVILSFIILSSADSFHPCVFVFYSMDKVIMVVHLHEILTVVFVRTNVGRVPVISIPKGYKLHILIIHFMT